MILDDKFETGIGFEGDAAANARRANRNTTSICAQKSRPGLINFPFALARGFS
jgi:hypothetical protein